MLDASTLLAYLQDEPGHEQIDVVLAEASISSVNWAEVVQKSVAAGVDIEGMQQDVCALGLVILPFIAEEAEYAGRLWQQTWQWGWSLDDRACLSLGHRLQAPVLTADRTWTTLDLPVIVHLLR